MDPVQCRSKPNVEQPRKISVISWENADYIVLQKVLWKPYQEQAYD